MTDDPWMAERRIPSPEEMQIIIRRAHAARAKVLEDAVRALRVWRKQGASQVTAPAGLNAAPCA